jgi:hypothetical protein
MVKADKKNEDLKTFWILSASMLLIGVALKLLYIFYVTRRNGSAFNSMYPFDSYLYDPFHRFTDWLIPFDFSKTQNPWDINSELSKHLPPVPYGPTTFFYLSFTSFLGSVLPFFMLVVGYLFINFKLLQRTLIREDSNIIFLIFIALVIGFYPLHFVIDRGNTAIIGAVLISLIYYLVMTKFTEELTSKSIYVWAIEILFSLLLTSKPSWGLCLLPSFYFSKKSFFRIIFASTLIYLLPILINDISIFDYANSIKLTYSVVGGNVDFSSDLWAGFSVILVGILKIPLNLNFLLKFFLLVGLALLLSGSIYIYKADYCSKKIRFVFFLSFILLLTLLFNRPSFDYNLIVIFPLIIGVLMIANCHQKLNVFVTKYLALSFFLIASWGWPIGKISKIQFSVPFRSLGLLMLGIYLFYFFFSQKRQSLGQSFA